MRAVREVACGGFEGSIIYRVQALRLSREECVWLARTVYDRVYGNLTAENTVQTPLYTVYIYLNTIITYMCLVLAKPILIHVSQ